jgi:hypothetical protein
METQERRKLGKKTRAQGKAFEIRVRHDLEKQGWIVDKWSNNVEFEKIDEFISKGKLISAKHKYNYFTKKKVEYVKKK